MSHLNSSGHDARVDDARVDDARVDDARVDDARVDDARVGAVRVLARLHRMFEVADSGLTVAQYRVLAAIAQGGVRSAHLAERLAVRRPTLTAIADGLVAAGLACRESEVGDRRVVRLHATDEGRAALVRADEAYLARFNRLLAEIPHPDRLVEDLLTVGDAFDARLRADLPVPTDHLSPEAAE